MLGLAHAALENVLVENRHDELSERGNAAPLTQPRMAVRSILPALSGNFRIHTVGPKENWKLDKTAALSWFASSRSLDHCRRWGAARVGTCGGFEQRLRLAAASSEDR